MNKMCPHFAYFSSRFFHFKHTKALIQKPSVKKKKVPCVKIMLYQSRGIFQRT